jgi:dTDP-4-dehydrorhamnose reductase
MRILVFGAAGMLGHKLVQRLAAGFEVIATIRGDAPPTGPAAAAALRQATLLRGIDVERPGDIERAIAAAQPQVVLNAVGVVKQLAAAKDPLRSIAINALLPHRLAAACRDADPPPRLIHFSTDCVFSGRGGPYAETHPADADDLYGRTKFLGEVAGPACLTIRSSIVGREIKGAHGLLEWFIAQRGKKAPGYTKALYSGLTTNEMADLVGRLIAEHRNLEGVWHVASEPIAKYDLLRIVNRQYGLGVEIAADDEFHCDRRLDGGRFAAATGYRAPPWEAMIAAMRADPTPYD